MIAPVKRENPTHATLHDAFLKMLPQIRQQAHVAFRALPPESRNEMVAEVVANSFCAFVRLVSLGKADVAYPTPLAQYAIQQVRVGRRVGNSLNSTDVMSRQARKAGVSVERLDRFDSDRGEWMEVLVESRHCGPAQTAAARLDVGMWLSLLSDRDRRIAEMLARGERTLDVAQQFGLSPGRVSQLRALFQKSWNRLQGDADDHERQHADAMQ